MTTAYLEGAETLGNTDLTLSHFPVEKKQCKSNSLSGKERSEGVKMEEVSDFLIGNKQLIFEPQQIKILKPTSSKMSKKQLYVITEIKSNSIQ